MINKNERSLLMNDFVNITKKLIYNLLKYKWATAFLLLVGYFIYQTSFSWENSAEVSHEKKLTNEEEVVFIVIQENYIGASNSGFDSLADSMQTWDFDEKSKKLYLKHQKSLPYTLSGSENNKFVQYDNTKVIILYDRGFDSFERYSEVLKVSTLPYQYFFKNEPLITVHQIDSTGTVFLEFKGKQIQLKANEDYPDLSIKGFQLVKTGIQNHGIYNKKQFVPFIKQEKRSNKLNSNKKDDETLNNKEEKDEKILPNIHY
jgi:hypothetical protein